jgi:HEAT repeat protein
MDFLLEAMDSGPEVRRSVVQALGQLAQSLDEEQSADSPAPEDSEEERPEDSEEEVLEDSEAKSLIVSALNDALEDEDEKVRENVVYELSQIASDESAPALIKALASENDYIRQTAAVALGEIGDVQAGPVLADIAKTDDAAQVRRAAVNALASIKNNTAISSDLFLVEVAADAPQPREKEIDVLASAKIDPVIVPGLIDVARDDGASQIRIEAVNVLARIKNDPRIVPGLIDTTKTEVDPMVRIEAVRALDSIKDDPRVIPGLIDVAKSDSDAGIRIEAVNALAGFDGREAADCLIGILEEGTEQDDTVRQTAVSGLAKMKDTKAWIYTSALKGESAWITSLISGKHIIYGLLEELTSKDPSIRVETMKALKEKVGGAVDLADDVLLRGETNPAAIKCWRILQEWVIYTLNRVRSEGVKMDISGNEEKETRRIWNLAEDARALMQSKPVKVRTITLRRRSDQAGNNEAWGRLNKIASELREVPLTEVSRLFEAFARDVSEGPYAKNGGDMGFVNPGQVASEINPVIFDLEKGQISDVVVTEAGYQIFLAEEVDESDEGSSNREARRIAGQILKEIDAIFRENTEAGEAIIRASAENPQEIGEREEGELVRWALHTQWASEIANSIIHQILESLRRVPRSKGGLFAFRRQMIYELSEKLKGEIKIQKEPIIGLFGKIEGDNVTAFYKSLYKEELGWVLEKAKPRDAAFMRGLLTTTALNLCKEIRTSAAKVINKLAPLLKVDEIKMKTVLPRLKEMFANDGDKETRSEAAEAIGEIIVNLETAPKVRAVLDEEIKAISQIFVDVIKDQKQPGEVRAIAAETLGKVSSCLKRHRIKLPEEEQQITRDSLQKFFIDTLRTVGAENKAARAGLAGGIGHVGDFEGATFLLEMLKKEKGPEVRAAIILALGQIAPSVSNYDVFEEIISALNAAMLEEHTNTRINAAKGISRLCRNFPEVSKDETPFLVRAMKDKDRYVRGAAATALLRSGDQTVVDELYHDPNELKAYEMVAQGREDAVATFTMTNIVTHLGQFGGFVAAREEERAVHLERPLIELGPSCIPALRDVFEEKLDDPFLLTAANVLAEVGKGDPRAIDIMIKAYPFITEGSRRMGMIQALAILGGEKAVDFLAQIVKSDSSSRIRSIAATELFTGAECENKEEILKSYFGEEHDDILMTYASAQAAKTNKIEEIKNTASVAQKARNLEKAKREKRRTKIWQAQREFNKEAPKVKQSQEGVARNRALLVASGRNSIPAILPMLSKEEIKAELPENEKDAGFDLMLGILCEIGSGEEVLPIARFLLSAKGRDLPFARKKALEALIKFGPALKQAIEKEETEAVEQSKWPRWKRSMLRLSKAAVRAKYRIGCSLESISVGKKPKKPKTYRRRVRDRLRYFYKYLRWRVLRLLNRLIRRGTSMKENAIKRDPFGFALDAVLKSGVIIEDDKAEGKNVREAAVNALEVFEATEEQVIDAYIKALKNENAEVRKFAVEILGGLAKGLDEESPKRKRILNALLDLTSDSDGGVREKAGEFTHALGATTEQVIAANVEALASPHKEVWLEAVKYFTEIKGKKAVKPMTKLLFDPEAENVILVATALGAQEDASAIGALGEALLSTTSTDAHKVIMEVIVKLSALTKSGAPKKTIGAIITLLPNWGEDIRENVKRTLVELGVDPERIAWEVTRAHEELVEPEKLKLSFREKIARWLLRYKLGSKDTEKRKVAVDAFEKYEEYTAEDARVLVYMLYDENVDVSISAMNMLSRPAGIKALPYLIDELSESENSNMHLMIISILGSLAEHEDIGLTLGLALKPLIEQLSSKDESVRQAAYTTILLICSDVERVIGNFVYLLSNEDAGVRADAEKFLKDFVARLGYDYPEVQSAVAHMVDLLSEEALTQSLYETTIKALRIMNAPPKVLLQAMGNAARNPDQNIWGQALEDIVNLGLPGAKELLETVIAESQEDNLKRVTMAAAVPNVQGPKAPENMMDIISDICSLAGGNEEVCAKAEANLAGVALRAGGIHPELQEKIIGLASRPDLTPPLYAATVRAERIMNASPEQLLGVMGIALRNSNQGIWEPAMNDIAGSGLSGAKELLDAAIGEMPEDDPKRAALAEARQGMESPESGQQPGDGQTTELNSSIILPLSGLSIGLGIVLFIVAMCIKAWKLGKLDGEKQLPSFERFRRGLGIGWQRLKLKSPWKGLRASAVEGLGIYSHGSKEVTISIMESLYDHKDVAASGLDILKRLRSNKTAQDLAAAVSDPEKDKWIAIRLALTELGASTESIAEGQIKVLSKCPHRGARVSAVEFLTGAASGENVSREEKDRIISALVSANTHDRDLNVRRATLSALDKLGVPAEDRVQRPIRIRIYRAAAIARWGFDLKNFSKKGRLSAVERLAKFAPDSREARIKLIEALYDDMDVALAAVDVLGNLVDDPVIKQLVDAVSDENQNEWVAIRWALTQYGVGTKNIAYKQLKILSKCQHSGARASAAEYLPNIAANSETDPKLKMRITNALIAALKDSDSQVRTAVTAGLIRSLEASDEMLIEGFTKALRSRHLDARKDAVIALGTMALSHPKESETRNRIIDILLDAAESKKLDIQPIALSTIYSLESAGRQRTRFYILMLENDEMAQRRAAASILGDSGDKMAVRPLRRQLKRETDRRVSEAIQEALVKLTGKPEKIRSQKPAPAATAPVQPRAPAQTEEMAPLAKMLFGSKQQATSVGAEAEQVTSTAFSGITKIVFNGKEVSLDQAMRNIQEMATKVCIFNIRIEGNKISIGVAKGDQRHPQIKDPKIGLGNFRGIIEGREFSVVFDTYAGPGIKMSEDQRQMIAKVYGSGYVRIARFFVENGFPASYSLGTSTKLVFRQLRLFQTTPQTIGELARKPLEGEQKTAPAKAEKKTTPADDKAKQKVPTPAGGIKELIANGKEVSPEMAKSQIPRMAKIRLVFNARVEGSKLLLGVAKSDTKHEKIQNPSVGPGTFRGIITKTRFAIIFDGYEGPGAKISDDRKKEVIGLYRNSYVGLAKFFVDNGFPPSFKLDSSTKILFEQFGFFQKVPQTIGELAGQSLKGGQKTASVAVVTQKAAPAMVRQPAAPAKAEQQAAPAAVKAGPGAPSMDIFQAMEESFEEGPGVGAWIRDFVFSIGRWFKEMWLLLPPHSSDKKKKITKIKYLAKHDATGGWTIKTLVEHLGETDLDIVLVAMEQLSKSENRAVVAPHLIDALSKKDSSIRFRAAAILGTLGVAEAAEPLLKCLADEDQKVRKSAYNALFNQLKASGKALRQKLISLLIHENEDIRKDAVEFLKEYALSLDPRSPEKKQTIEKVTDQLCDRNLTYPYFETVARALWVMNATPEQLSKAMKYGVSNRNQDVRGAAQNALDKIRDGGIGGQRTSPAGFVLPLIGSEGLMELNSSTVSVLIVFGVIALGVVLYFTIRHFSRKRAAALREVRRFADPTRLTLVPDEEEMTSVRREVASLAKRGDEKAIGLLIKKLEHPYQKVREVAIQGLVAIGGPAVEPLKKQLLVARLMTVKKGSLDALKGLMRNRLVDETEVARILMEVSKTKDPMISRFAEGELSAFGYETNNLPDDTGHTTLRSIDPLTAALCLGLFGVSIPQWIAIPALFGAAFGIIAFFVVRRWHRDRDPGEKFMKNKYMRWLKSSKSAVRAAAAKSLGEMGLGAKYAVFALSRAMVDENKDVRAEAVKAVGKIGASSQRRREDGSSRRAVEVDPWEMKKIHIQSLVDVMLMDKEEDVRKAAEEALILLGEDAEHILAENYRKSRRGAPGVGARAKIKEALNRIRTDKCQKLVERGDPVAIQRLIHIVLSNSLDADDAYKIARHALFKLGERAIPQLEERLAVIHPVISSYHLGRDGVRREGEPGPSPYRKEIELLIEDIREETVLNNIAGYMISGIARGENIPELSARAMWDLEWKAKTNRDRAIEDLTQRIKVHAAELDAEKATEAVRWIKRFNRIANGFVEARREMRYFSGRMPRHMLNKPASFQEILGIVQTYFLRVNSGTPVNSLDKRMAESLIPFILNRGQRVQAISRGERDILAGNRNVLSLVLMTVSHSLTPLLREDRINSVIADYTQRTDLYRRLGEERIIEGYARAMREIKITDISYYDADYDDKHLYGAFELSISVGEGEKKEDVGYTITFDENGTPYDDGRPQMFIKQFGELYWMALRDKFRGVHMEPEIFKEAFNRATAIDRIRNRDKAKTREMRVVLPDEEEFDTKPTRQMTVQKPFTPMERIQGILPFLIIALQTLNYKAEEAEREVAEDEGKAFAEVEGRIIIAIDDDLGSGWTRDEVQNLRKTLALLSRRRDKLGELTRRIKVRHGEGKNLADRLTRLVSINKIKKENIIIVANEKNRGHFSGFDGISTMTCINESDKLELEHYYPLVEIVLYTLARALMNKGASGYDRGKVRDFYEFISNVGKFDESVMYGSTVVIQLIPGARPITADRQVYRDIAKFITTAA